MYPCRGDWLSLFFYSYLIIKFIRTGIAYFIIAQSLEREIKAKIKGVTLQSQMIDYGRDYGCIDVSHNGQNNHSLQVSVYSHIDGSINHYYWVLPLKRRNNSIDMPPPAWIFLYNHFRHILSTLLLLGVASVQDSRLYPTTPLSDHLISGESSRSP